MVLVQHKFGSLSNLSKASAMCANESKFSSSSMVGSVVYHMFDRSTGWFTILFTQSFTTVMCVLSIDVMNALEM